MKQKSVKIGITSLVLVLALGGLLYSTLSEGTEFYKHVDEVMVNPEAWHGKNLQLHGFVVKDSILRKRDSLEYRFQVQSKGAVIDATYTGIVPDTFKDESEVGTEGTAGRQRFSRGAERCDGEVPIQVRSEERADRPRRVRRGRSAAAAFPLRVQQQPYPPARRPRWWRRRRRPLVGAGDIWPL